ncbi:hypothetical protein ACFPN0_32810, partial [Kitasatospora cinereorecta]
MSIGGVEPPLHEDEENRSDAAQQARADGSGVLGDVPAAGPGVAGEPGAAGRVLPGAGSASDGEDRADGDRTPPEAADGTARGGPAGDPVSGAGAGVRGGDLAGEGAGDGAPGDVAPPRFRPEGQRDLAPAGQGERARANLAALETLRVLEREQRPATEEDQRTLARWSGWGALPVIFNPRPARAAFGEGDAEEEKFERAAARWDAVSDLREQIRELLSEDEWAAARRNTINAHYTDADLVRSIWGAVRGLGFTGGRVLEPGSGSGNFIGFAPILTSTPVQMTGVEVEPTTAAIARHLYPDAEIITSGLEEVPLADGGFDGVVGNVPFGRYKRFDKVHNADLSLSIHDHFVLKSLYATRPAASSRSSPRATPWT